MARRRPKEAGPEVELPITPMLDMAFQLMVFFIFTYSPSGLETNISTKLLATKTNTARPKDAPPEKDAKTSSTKETEPDSEENLVVIIEALTKKDKVDPKNEGTPKRILLEAPESAGKRELVSDKDDDWAQGKQKLEARLKKYLAKNLASDSTGIDIQFDGALKFQYLVTIQDICRIKYGVKPEGGREVLLKLGRNHKAKDFAKVAGFSDVNFKPPADTKKPAK